MFTLIRPIAALGLAILAWFAAQAFGPLYERDVAGTTFYLTAAGLGGLTGWLFLGGRLGGALWLSVFSSLQAVVLAAVVTGVVFAVRDGFIQGYRRWHREPIDAVLGMFETAADYARAAWDRDFLILLGVGGVVLGVALHLLFRLLEARRLTR